MIDNFLPMMLQSIASLAAVLALFAGLVWLVRRLQGSSFQVKKGGQMKVVQRLALDTKHSLVEVTCGQHHYLIGLSPDGMTSISQPVEQLEYTASQESDT